MDLWKRIEASGSGEPGLYFSNDKDWGTNPCCEIALRPYQFCNLTEVNASDVENQTDLEARVRAASFLGTLQAGYTDFHYLREIWRKTTEKDALLGVSMTGIASNRVEKLDLEMAAFAAKLENSRVSKILGIKEAARVTCVKPAGTTSLVLGTSSGIHAWHDEYYIRRIRVGKNEAIYGYLSKNHPELVEDEFFNPTQQAVISVPQKAPEGATTRSENVFELLERIKNFSIRWVNNGHREGSNTHNVSATVSIKGDEWNDVGEWMWMNRHYYNGLSVLPYDGGTYTQAPFETCDKETYEKLSKALKGIDLTQVIETTDETNLSGELACAGGVCEVETL
jgi:ribonucleoside-diphosphate reductase alpha chain|tara:strand:- start:483 stop:1496 length:1014 start_codon:yes stop_codon:yes gene_type:complete